MDIQLREGKPNDITQVLGLIKELAEFEKAPEQVTNTVEQLINDGFGSSPFYNLWVAEDINSQTIVGFALTYYRYSTWKGKVLYLEDLYIQPAYRGYNLGTRFFEILKQHAHTQHCQRISWQVLEWNQPAINFYKKLGASFDKEWVNAFLEI